MNKLIIGVIIACLVVSFTAGYVKAESPTITIVDSAGREVTLPYPVEKAIVLHTDAAKAVAVFGAEDQVAGVKSDLIFPPSLKDKPEVGKWSDPNFETIIELEPDVVICYGYQASEFEENLQPAGIPLAAMDCYKMGTFISDMETMGLIFGKENRAEEYIDFVQGYLDLVQERVNTLEPEEQVKVYIEKNNTPYKSYSVGSGMHDLVTLAGGINIAADEPIPYPEVSPEWVLEQEPEVMVTYFYKPYHPSGYGMESSETMEQWRDEVLSRPGWTELVPAAARGNERVDCLSSHVCFGTSMPVGLCYLAKWFYPNLFSDIDPKTIHRELMVEFMDYEPEGTFAYPEFFGSWDYDKDGDGEISKAEAIKSVQDYFNELIAKAQAIQVVMLYFG